MVGAGSHISSLPFVILVPKQYEIHRAPVVLNRVDPFREIQREISIPPLLCELGKQFYHTVPHFYKLRYVTVENVFQ